MRSVTEPQEPQIVLGNIDKYFATDAFILHPWLNQPEFARGRDNLKALYSVFRRVSRDNKITFHGIMFNDDMTQCTLDLTEEGRAGIMTSILTKKRALHFLVRLDLRKDADGKYRIWRQLDIVLGDYGMLRSILFPQGSMVNQFIKACCAVWTILFGRYLSQR